ncbi:hypothetical protein YC2023_016396 [Brassica napus]
MHHIANHRGRCCNTSSLCPQNAKIRQRINFGMHMEQQLENFSWVHRDENMNVPLKQEGLHMQFDHTYRDITCSASSSLKSYSGLFGKSSNIKTPKIETSSIPGTSADPS